MAKKKRQKIEFRYYKMPSETYMFALLGKKWIREYGYGIGYLHFHNLLEIGYCLNGEGEMVFGNRNCEYHGGEFTVIPKNFPHTTNSIPGTKSHWEYLFIDEASFLKHLYGERQPYKRCVKIEKCINSSIHFFTPQENPELAGEIRCLLEIMRRKEVFYLEEAEGVLASLLIKIARVNESKGELFQLDKEDYVTERASEIVAEAMSYISRHYKDTIHIEDLARYSHISETHFRRLFSNHMKMGILEYINLVRIHEACEQLKKTDDSIADIAERCGFSTISTFNRNFKCLLKISPCSWRKQPENCKQQLLKYEIHAEEGW